MTRLLYEPHPRIGFRFIPGLKARVEHEGGGYLLRVNQAGFRSDREFVSEAAPGKFRILLFGDSYTAGDGVANRDRYSDQLERLVPGVEVYNFGLSNTGTDQQYLIWEEFAQGVACDLVVLGVLVENIRRNVARYRPALDGAGHERWLAKPYFELGPGDRLTLGGVPVPPEPVSLSDLPESAEAFVDRGGRHAGVRRWINRMLPGLKRRLQRGLRPQPLPAYDRAEHPDWRLMRAILTAWIDRLEVPVWILPLPLYHYVEDLASAANYQARFAELDRPPRVRVLDPLAALRQAPLAERRTYRFAHDPHPTPAAHRVLAEFLAAELRSAYPGLETVNR